MAWIFWVEVIQLILSKKGFKGLILIVIPGLDPGIHFDFELLVFIIINANFKMDCRVKPGNDGGG